MKRISTPLHYTIIIIIIHIFVINISAQNISIFPDLTGRELIDSLQYYYKPATVLSYDNARDTMYAAIDNYNDSITCVYSGYSIWLDPAEDPSSDAYSKEINAEHTWPQSKGADAGNAKSDLHHLFPCRVQVNSSRGNAPFDEIADSQTDSWWRHNYSQSTIPASYIDEYSEKENDNGYFEPREDHKGNAARSVFYFYTMYESQADSDFFNLQKGTLRSWHDEDIADSRENERNNLIAPYQDGKKNPFILDSSLVRRAYFSGDISDTSSNNAQPGDIIITEIMQNPAAVYDSEGEWFEIYNNTDREIDINGWFIKDNDTDQHQINNGGPLIFNGHSFMVLGLNSDSGTNGGVPVDYQYSGITLANGDDELILCLDDNYTEIDRIEYDGGTQWPDPTGTSMCFKGAFSENNNDPALWQDADIVWDGSSGDKGTPGYDNTPSVISGKPVKTPVEFTLTNYPNPFNPSTNIVYQLPRAASVEIEIYDIRGRILINLVNEFQSAGKWAIAWNGTDRYGNKLASGIYFIQLKSGKISILKKVTLLR